MAMMASKENESLPGTDIPWVLIYHLMKNNFKWRETVQQHIPFADGDNKIEDNSSGVNANLPPDNDFDDFFNEGEFNLESSKSPVIHPNDILLNTVMYCTLELKQVIFQKLFMCKHSVPLIYRIPSHDIPCFSLFPLRSLSMECKTKSGATMLCAATMKSKVVGFIRVGNSRYSKSKLLNSILSDQKHATFCHRDAVLENTKPLNAKGLIEAAWLLPSGKKCDPFEEVITFLNLRGDGACIPNELSIIGRTASAIVTLIDISCLDNEANTATVRTLCNSSVHNILLLTNSFEGITTEKLRYALERCFPTKQSRENVKFVRTFGSKINDAKPEVALRNELLTAIEQVVHGKEGISLSQCGRKLVNDNLVVLDETTDDSIKGLSHAKEIFAGLCALDEADQFCGDDIENVPDVTSKEEQLPFQGHLWKRWSELNKKLHKNKGRRSINALDDTQKEMHDIKQKQAEQCNNLSRSMSLFLKHISMATESSDGYPNVLLWLKIILNENSRSVIPRLLTEFRQSWLTVIQAKENHANENEIKILQEAAEMAEMKLVEASFGLEHFMRELGQLYESSILSKQPIAGSIPKHKLPETMADLILKGQEFEILDGDAANIPVNWVKEVLNCLKGKIGDKKLFIVSILGIQSSGKSTLLNAMFGLQFTVRAGRCTRGIFGQLVPFDNKKSLPYDYVFVVDTEGLKAPELSEVHRDHDNELATFVIGIGDVTLINIKGENAEEMKDVLQITVQAFLRMKLANSKMKLKHKCIFVHQNVSAVNAEEQMMQGLKKFQEHLDEMTKNAAEEENMRQIDRFSQVIDFQCEKHVLYFPDLWYGDPPMAPSNPGYSMKVSELLQRVEEIATSGRSTTTIDSLTHKVEDLWNGIMAENFVFSFRNTLEIKTYNAMESKYQEFAGEYGRCLMEWFEEKASIDLDLCKSESSLNDCCEGLKHHLRVGFQQRKAEIESQLIDYFDNHDLDYIVIQWKQSRIFKFQTMAETVERNTLHYIEQKNEEQRIVILSKSANMKLEEVINSKANELAEAYRGKEIETRELELTFDKVWVEWTKEFVQIPELTSEMIENMFIDSLFELVTKHQALVEKELKSNEGEYRLKRLDIPQLEASWTTDDINAEYIDFPSCTQKGAVVSINEQKRKAVEYTDNIFRKLDVEFAYFQQKDIQIRQEHAWDVINKTVKMFEEENCKPEPSLTFQSPYEVKLIVYVCSFAFLKFKLMADRYDKKHGVKGKLATYKDVAKRLFINTVQEKSHEFVAADFFCDRMKERVVDAINTSIPRQIAEDVMGHFSYLKYHVMLEVMGDLARKGDFESFILYIKDSRSFVHKWMNNFINEEIFNTKGTSEPRYLYFAKGRLSKIMKCIKSSISAATSEAVTKGENWAQLFELNMKTELAVPSDLLDDKTKILTDIQNFKGVLNEKLLDLEKEILKFFQCRDASEIIWKGSNPNETIMNLLWGCPEQCPFCAEPCQRNEGHLADSVSHSCIQHRPPAVRGLVWVASNKLSIEPCNFEVQSDHIFSCGACQMKCRESGKCEMSYAYHPFKKYKTYIPDWDIAPNPTMDVTKYWMWFVAKYLDELCVHYRAEKTEIPESWKMITDDEALESLRMATE